MTKQMTKLEQVRRVAKKAVGASGQSYCEKTKFGWSWKCWDWTQEQAVKAAELLDKEGFTIRVVQTRSEFGYGRYVGIETGLQWRVHIFS